MPESFSIVEVIQLMLAPGIMISACGLLLLGMNNKYSLVVNRIRILNEEKRRFVNKAAEKDFSYEETIRSKAYCGNYPNCFRVTPCKERCLLFTMCSRFICITSLLIGVQYFGKFQSLNYLNYNSFSSLGMLAVLAGVIFAVYETIKGYQIIDLEVKSEE